MNETNVCTFGGVVMTADGPRVGCDCKTACAAFPRSVRPPIGPVPVRSRLLKMRPRLGTFGWAWTRMPRGVA